MEDQEEQLSSKFFLNLQSAYSFQPSKHQFKETLFSTLCLYEELRYLPPFMQEGPFSKMSHFNFRLKKTEVNLTQVDVILSLHLTTIQV